jgi:mono/diheme cytochrome c family protein
MATFAEELQTSLERRGETLLREFCADCHAIGRSGDSPHPAAPPFRHIDRRYPIETLRQTLQEGLLISGHPDMPTFRFRREDVKPVIAYLLSIQKD